MNTGLMGVDQNRTSSCLFTGSSASTSPVIAPATQSAEPQGGAIVPPIVSITVTVLIVGKDRVLIIMHRDGFILTQAYNTAVSSSAKSWGFIPEEDIHDTARLPEISGASTPDVEEGKRDKEWTFRRVGNLTCWAA